MHRTYETIREVFVLLEIRVAEELAKKNLRSEQYNALRLLAEGDSLRMGELSARLLVDDSTTTRIVDSLEAAGLVRRTQDPSDRRAMRVAITESGRRRERDAAKAVHDVADKALASLSKQQRQHLSSSLKALREGLDAESQQATGETDE